LVPRDSGFGFLVFPLFARANFRHMGLERSGFVFRSGFQTVHGLALLYGAVVEMGIGRIPTNINNLSLMVHLKTLLGKSDVLQNIYSWPAAGVAGAVGSLLFGAAIFLSLAAVMFTFKEYHRISETKK